MVMSSSWRFVTSTKAEGPANSIASGRDVLCFPAITFLEPNLVLSAPTSSEPICPAAPVTKIMLFTFFVTSCGSSISLCWVLAHIIKSPPLISSEAPVIYEALSDTRKATSSATSFGVPSLGIGKPLAYLSVASTDMFV